MRKILVCVAFVLGCRSSSPGYGSANAGYSSQGPAVPVMPRSVRVSLHGVTIAMGKFDGTMWDGPGHVPAGQLQRLGLALGATNPYAVVISILGEPVNQALEKPEVFGQAMLVTGAGYGPPTQLSARRDTFTPDFGGPPSWSGVPLNGTVRLSVTLTDDDLFFPDPMGSFQLNERDLVQALREGRVAQIRVAEQTSNQILFAAISVMGE